MTVLDDQLRAEIAAKDARIAELEARPKLSHAVMELPGDEADYGHGMPIDGGVEPLTLDGLIRMAGPKRIERLP
jgi:hypothetical protein